MNRFVPLRDGQGEHADRGSKFFATVFHAPEESVLRQRLQKSRKQHSKAQHWCWAWCWQHQLRFDDDGEPGGTAGMPMAKQLQSCEMDEIAVICVRWFGGVKLGSGGLSRAYRAATAKALASCTKKEIVPRLRLALEIPFADSGLRDELQAKFDDFLLQGEFSERGWVGVVELNCHDAHDFAERLLAWPRVQVTTEQGGPWPE